MPRVAITVLDTSMPPPDRDDPAVPPGLVYVGASMHPTFRDLDLLGVRKEPAVRVGDVIAFRLPGDGRTVVHRVTGVADGCYVTRGDGNRRADPAPVPPCAVLGLVATRTRNGREHTVLRGPVGLAVATARRAAHFASQGVGAVVLRSARAAAERLVAPRTTRLFRLDLVAVARPEGTAYLVRHRGRVIGVRGAGTGQWRLTWPYALFVDPDRVQPVLPSGPTAPPDK